MFRPLRPIRPVRSTRPAGAPLVRGLVVGGAAYAAARSAAQAQPVQPAAPVDDMAKKLTQLTELGALVQQGLLSPDEFARVKARLLV